ncbi:DUF2807 domain-containing protein [Persicobacter sp. CCB-QB2]|uniref:GIN domain-containing protein n=1 Tax=Persicobacter sp. CCB-QB2 TaxID=1561025 RepID=UPI0006A98381|nr:DUF2807 domain-containing protein [Persicobacter sp. CCB-QB2]
MIGKLKKLNIFGGLWLVLFLQACHEPRRPKNLQLETFELEVPPFRKLKVEGNFEVEIQPSNRNYALFEGNEECLKAIVMDWKGDTLLIALEAGFKPLITPRLCLDYQRLDGIYLMGNGKLESPQPLIFDHLEVVLSGLSDLCLTLDVLYLNMEMEGAGTMQLEGRARRVKAQLLGAGGLRAAGLLMDQAEIQVKGMGGAIVRVAEELKAEVSGIGGILCLQKPVVLKQKVTGAGRVEIQEENEKLK